ncbi:MAG: hypothetical protein A3H97_24075 [Acidobacteria bacterium RIFCSPLOWO2_02_FULL_65_29]|nr:MAG: hypothetical protein A3H97_24075 [Acidobacteria bacterium RIFCSPLOWO2_02_FULL_65_29]
MPSAAILVGGAASRFGGREKSALVVGGRTILERQLAELSRVTSDLMLVGGNDLETTPPEGCPPLRAVPDRVRGHGALGGLDAALAAARDEVVLILACDMPFVTNALVAHLIALATSPPGAGRPAVVVPITDRGYHPLCAVYARSCQTLVARHLAERRLALKELLGAMSTSEVRVVTDRELEAFGDPDYLLANVNTPAEYEVLEALQGHGR